MKKRISVLLLAIALLLPVFLMTACSTQAAREKMLIGSWVDKYDPEGYIVFCEYGTGYHHLDTHGEFYWVLDGDNLILQEDDDVIQAEIIKLTKQELTFEPTSSGYRFELVRE